MGLVVRLQVPTRGTLAVHASKEDAYDAVLQASKDVGAEGNGKALVSYDDRSPHSVAFEMNNDKV